MDKATNDYTNFKYFFVLLAIVVFLWIISCACLYNMEERGTFGDMFGAINALFSGCAFAGLIYALFLQKKELSLQREELKETRKELKGQKEQLEYQNLTLKKQNFEDTFFHLIDLHNNIVNNLEYNPKTGSKFKDRVKGRDCFNVFYKIYKDYYKMGHRMICKNSNNEIDIIQQSYQKFYSETLERYGHYFLSLYNIAKFIKNSEVDNKKFYLNLLRAQLSYNELALLFYNCLSVPIDKDKKIVNKFRPIIVEFSLFNNLPTEILLNKDHIKEYKQDAFI